MMIIRLVSIFILSLSFSPSLASACSTDPNKAAQEAYNWFNPVKEFDSGATYLGFTYEIKNHKNNETNECSAIARCNQATGRWEVYQPETSDKFYDAASCQDYRPSTPDQICHCDPDGDKSKDFRVFDCSKCNNHFCREKTYNDHIKSYKCYVK